MASTKAARSVKNVKASAATAQGRLQSAGIRKGIHPLAFIVVVVVRGCSRVEELP
jgi:hypothetical protein